MKVTDIEKSIAVAVGSAAIDVAGINIPVQITIQCESVEDLAVV